MTFFRDKGRSERARRESLRFRAAERIGKLVFWGKKPFARKGPFGAA